MKRRRWLVLGVVACVLIVGFRWWRARTSTGRTATTAGASKAEEPRLILERPWIDRIPEKATEHMNAFLMIDRESLGIFQKGSQYQIFLELFRHKRGGTTAKPEVGFMFPQTGKQAKVKYRIWSCDDLDGFDLCLELSKNPWGGPTRYHSAREWEGSGALRDVQVRLLDATH